MKRAKKRIDSKLSKFCGESVPCRIVRDGGQVHLKLFGRRAPHHRMTLGIPSFLVATGATPKDLVKAVGTFLAGLSSSGGLSHPVF